MPLTDAGIETGLRAAYATWFDALEAGDVARALSVVTADVVHQGPSGVTHVGREALGAALAALLAVYAEHIEWELEVVALAGDEAEVSVRELTILQPRDGGSRVRVVGRHTGRLRRDVDGRWHIAQDVSVLDGPPTPVDEACGLPDD